MFTDKIRAMGRPSTHLRSPLHVHIFLKVKTADYPFACNVDQNQPRLETTVNNSWSSQILVFTAIAFSQLPNPAIRRAIFLSATINHMKGH